MVEYHPFSAKDLSRLHQLGPKVLPGEKKGTRREMEGERENKKKRERKKERENEREKNEAERERWEPASSMPRFGDEAAWRTS